MTLSTDNGIGTDPATDPPTSFAIACFVAIALYNVLELNVIIFSTFKRRRGLYFWSFLIATWGIAPYGIGFILKFVDQSGQNILIVVLISIGWCCMVTGQSMVLYSRLHLVLWNPTHLRIVLGIITFDAVICHIPTIVLAAGANTTNNPAFELAYSVYERVQVTIFFVQELVISGIYISETVKLLRSESHIRGRRVHRVMSHLIYVNVVVIMLDIVILALEYLGLYNIQTGYKALAYSVKLKLEFGILNRLLELTKSGTASSSDHSNENVMMSLNTIEHESLKEGIVQPPTTEQERARSKALFRG
jgi:hypothetical protein